MLQAADRLIVTARQQNRSAVSKFPKGVLTHRY